MGRPPVCPLLSHLLGGAGHRVVSHNGNTHQGTENDHKHNTFANAGFFSSDPY